MVKRNRGGGGIPSRVRSGLNPGDAPAANASAACTEVPAVHDKRCAQQWSRRRSGGAGPLHAALVWEETWRRRDMWLSQRTRWRLSTGRAGGAWWGDQEAWRRWRSPRRHGFHNLLKPKRRMGMGMQGDSTRGRIPPALGSSPMPSLLLPRRGALGEREDACMCEWERVRHDLGTKGSREAWGGGRIHSTIRPQLSTS
jgi:hypothetical protein